MNYESIKKPALLIDRQKVRTNIRTMKDKADANHLIFRPHFKTHQSGFVGELFREMGIEKITVSSITMAGYFAKNGWNDITVAFPFNIREFDELQQLAVAIKINVLISSAAQISYLSKNLHSIIGFFIKIDTGYHRSGLEASQLAEIEQIITIAKKNKNLLFKGFLSHFGNTYHARNKEEVTAIFNAGVLALNILKSNYIIKFPDITISVGDTPSCSLVDKLEGVDEIRPGNFVYYDLTQMQIGSCNESQIAVAVACPVIDKNLKRNEVLIYGGAVHFSKEYIVDNQNNISFGAIVELSETGWGKSLEGTYLKSISQEHGIIQTNADSIDKFQIGKLIGVLPIHSCLTANELGDFVMIN